MFIYTRLPDSEKEHARAASAELALIDRMLVGFEHAIALFDHCEMLISQLRQQRPDHTSPALMGSYVPALRRLIAWQDVAIRDGAIRLWDSFAAMTAVRKNIEKCPEAKKYIQRGHLDAVIKKFKLTYPDLELIRHAAAHEGDLTHTPAQESRNAKKGAIDIPQFKMPGNKSSTIRHRHERTMTYTINGKIVSYELSQKTLIQLREYQAEFYGGFSAIDSALDPFRS